MKAWPGSEFSASDLGSPTQRYVRFNIKSPVLSPLGQKTVIDIGYHASVKLDGKGFPQRYELKGNQLNAEGKNISGQETLKVVAFSYPNKEKTNECHIEEVTYQDKSSFSSQKNKQILYNRAFCQKLREAYSDSKLTQSETEKCLNERRRFSQIFEDEIQKLRKESAQIAMPVATWPPIFIPVGSQEYHTAAETYAMLCGAILNGTDSNNPFSGIKDSLPKRKQEGDQ